jgi:hypothetical protein
MRRSLIVLLTLPLVMCSGIDNFQVDQKSQAFIPGATALEQLLGNVSFAGFDNFDITQNAELKNQGVTKNQIDSVKLSRVTMTVVEPASGQDFTFVTSLKFFVEAPGLPRALIAKGGPFPAGALTVELDLEDVELKPYATAESMNITTESNGEKPGQDTTVEAVILLDVDVNVGGAICGG